MARGYLIFILVAGFLASILSNAGSSIQSTSAGDNGQVDRPVQVMAMAENETATLPGDAIVLDRQDDGHFYADVEVNGQPIHILVDTGASGIALSRDDARRAGLAVSIGMNAVVGQGASGDVHGEYAMLDRVRLGSVEVERAQAIILDDGDQSLLGQSFLSKFASVEIRGDKMLLR